MSIIPEWLSDRAMADGLPSSFADDITHSPIEFEYTIPALQSLLYPKAMPLAVFLIGSYSTLRLMSFIKRGFSEWKWYFRWPINVAMGIGGFLIIGELLERVSDDSFDREDFQKQQKRNQALKQEVQRKKDTPPAPLNRIFTSGTGLERKLIRWEWDGEDWEINQGLRWVGRPPYVRYMRNSPHWIITSKRHIAD